jgi:signal transduction histidine kinase
MVAQTAAAGLSRKSSDAHQTAEDLIALTMGLSMARNLEQVMAIVRIGARALTGADGVTFVLRDGDQCHYADEDAVSPLWKGQRFPIGHCISGWVMLNGKPVAIADIFADPRIPHDAYRQTFVKSMAMVPVRAEDPVGAIGAYWAKCHQPPVEVVDLLQTIANLAAVALTNVTLFASLRRTAELAESRAEALQRALDQKSRFLAACSHDLRQPFQAMRLFHDVLTGMASDGQSVPLAKLGEAMAHGEELLTALLDVSTIDSGLIPVRSVRVGVQEVLDKAAATFAAPAEAQGVRLRIVPSRLAVVSDPVLLARIVDNLIANAVKFAPGGAVLVGARRRGGNVEIQVRDNGSGIAPQHLDEIFEDFFQVGNPSRDKRKGIGLGLGIVRRLAKQLGHQVNVCSAPGRGSLFRVTCRTLDFE